MNTERLECPRCRGHMAGGFLMDRADHGAATVAAWVSGEPEKSIWTGLKLKGHDAFPISTFRCERCGYLELYANPGADAK